jgi:hypothetical protein
MVELKSDSMLNDLMAVNLGFIINGVNKPVNTIHQSARNIVILMEVS